MNIPHDILEIIRDWRPVVDFEGLYKVSRLGEVHSIDRWVLNKHGKKQFFKERLIKPHTNKMGYRDLTLSKNNISYQKLIHRLVAEAFIPNPNNLPCVNHKDENKSNNFVWNLEFCTHKYNSNYGTMPERMRQSQLRENNSNWNKGKPVRCIETGQEFPNIKRAAEWVFNLGISNCKKADPILESIRQCCLNVRHKAYGYHWEYI